MTTARRVLALTRAVSPAIVDCELTHLERETIDVEAARAEHAAYERALEAIGCVVRQLPSDVDLPDAVFIEDTAVVDEVAVIARPGAESRRGETTAVSNALRAFRPLVEIVAPGTLDGGDVLRIGRRLFVGVGARTNEAGVEQLRALVAQYGYDVRAVAFTGCLHLKTAVTLVAEETLLINPDWVDATDFGDAPVLRVDPAEPFAANALLVGGRVIHGEAFVRTRKRMEDAGVLVVSVPAGELAKAEGGVTCCSLLVSLD